MQQLGSHQQRCTPVQTWDFLWIWYADVLLKKRIVLIMAATSRNSKSTSIKFTNQLERTFSSPPNMRKQPMIEHPDMPTLMNNRKFGCIILAEWKEGLRSSKAIGKDLVRLSRSSMMSFSASRRHQNTKRRSFILIDWQPITIGNFFCSSHGYFVPWFFPWDTGQMPGQGQRWGTTVCQLPTCVQELSTRLYPPMMTWWYPKMTILHFKRRVLWLDESRINPLKSRRFQDDFKRIIRCFQEFKMD